MLLDPSVEAVEEGRDAVAVPLLEAVAVVGLGDHPTLVGEHPDVVDEMGMLRPTGRDHAGCRVPDVFMVEPGDDGFVPLPHVAAQVWVGAGGDVPRPGQPGDVAEAVLLGVGALIGQPELTPVETTIETIGPKARKRPSRSNCGRGVSPSRGGGGEI